MADAEQQHGVCSDYCCCAPPNERDFYDEPEVLADGKLRKTIFQQSEPKPEIPIPEGLVEKVVAACACGRYQRVVAVPEESA